MVGVMGKMQAIVTTAALLNGLPPLRAHPGHLAVMYLFGLLNKPVSFVTFDYGEL